MQDDAGGGSGTVLDMHTQQGKKGVRFEDPHWWAHLPALKPIGLTCLLAEAKHSEVINRILDISLYIACSSYMCRRLSTSMYHTLPFIVCISVVCGRPWSFMCY